MNRPDRSFYSAEKAPDLQKILKLKSIGELIQIIKVLFITLRNKCLQWCYPPKTVLSTFKPSVNKRWWVGEMLFLSPPPCFPFGGT